jgi:hypothetical protein
MTLIQAVQRLKTLESDGGYRLSAYVLQGLIVERGGSGPVP